LYSLFKLISFVGDNYNKAMEKAAEIFFEHFGVSPGRKAHDIHRIGETFGEIPWENLTKFLLRAAGENRPRLAEEVMTDHVQRGTGGTCYSLTEALGTVIKACGVSARPLTGHMRHGKNIHCALLVEGAAGKFILDPGYVVPGAVSLSGDGFGEIVTASRSLHWVPVPGGFELHTIENGRRQFRYALESRVLTRNEFLHYWKASFEASGLNSLYLNRTGPLGGRLCAHNENLRTVGETGHQNRTIRDDYASTVSGLFGISSDVAEAAWNELQRQRKVRN
jgi:arylamine N-acetyltransferase